MSEQDFCLRMINSVLCYNPRVDDEGVLLSGDEILKRHNRYLGKYADVLGRDVVIAMIEEQQSEILGIEENVYTDSDGMTYNRIVYKD